MTAAPATGHVSALPLVLCSSTAIPGLASSTRPASDSTPTGPTQPMMTLPPKGGQNQPRQPEATCNRPRPTGAPQNHPSKTRTIRLERDEAVQSTVKSGRASTLASQSRPVGDEQSGISRAGGNKAQERRTGQVGRPKHHKALEVPQAPRPVMELPSQQQQVLGAPRSVVELPSPQQGPPTRAEGKRVTHRLAGQASSRLPGTAPVSPSRWSQGLKGFCLQRPVCLPLLEETEDPVRHQEGSTIEAEFGGGGAAGGIISVFPYKKVFEQN